MAGDWIKFEVSTPEKQEVLAITVAMGWDDPDLTVGKLLRVWRWFDQHTVDGNGHGVSAALLDRIAGVTGFASAMEKVGWLSVTADGIELSNFGRHNGETAKSRALTAKRVAKHKANAKDNEEGNGKGNAATVTAPLPKEEKRREEIKTTVPNGTDAGASQIADGIDAKDAIWQIAVPWLIERHVPDKSARSLMGAAVKVLDEGGAWALCQRMMDERPMEPAAWLAAALNAQAKVGAPGKGGRPMNKQEALEARNRQIAMEAVAEISGGLGQ